MSLNRNLSALISLLLTLCAAFCISTFASPPYAVGHDDGNGATNRGEYTVFLRDLNLLKHRKGLRDGQLVTLLVHTEVTAATHSTEEAIFKIKAKIGKPTKVDRLIYSHLDCSPGENVSIKAEGFIIPPGHKFTEPVDSLLTLGTILASDDSAAVARLHGAILKEEAKLPAAERLQKVSGTAGANDGQVLLRNSDHGSDEYLFDLTYIVGAESCGEISTISAVDPAAPFGKQHLVGQRDTDHDSFFDEEERACGSKPTSALSIPNYKRGTCQGAKTIGNLPTATPTVPPPQQKDGSGQFPCPLAGETISPYVDIYIPHDAIDPQVTQLTPLASLCAGATLSNYMPQLQQGNSAGEFDTSGQPKNTMHIPFTFQNSSGSGGGQNVDAHFRVTWH